MTSFQFLSLNEARESGIVWPDVYFTPEYGCASQISDQGKWEMAYCPDGPIIYPYLKRKLPPEFDDPDSFDLVSPYGYSGTWGPTSASTARWCHWRRIFRHEIRERGAVAEFQRLTPLAGDWSTMASSDPHLRITYHHDTVVVDVTDYASFWRGCQGRCRTAIRKARKQGFEVVVRSVKREDVTRTSPFRQLYEQTMGRVASAPYYFFSDEYFRELYRHLASHLRIYEVRDHSRLVVASGILLKWPPFVHLHLSGADPQAMRGGAGNLGYDAIIRWACQQPDLGALHLGGGVRPNDSLFHFKSSFSPLRLPFHTAKTVLNQEKYKRLLKVHAEHLEIPVHTLSNTDYFPAYRRLPATPRVSRRAA